MTTSETGSKGFILLEVLMAFAILVTGLALVSGLFSRHLGVLGVLSGSVTAHEIAERQIIQEALSRETTGLVLPSDPLPEGYTSQTLLNPIRLDQPPVKDLLIDEVTGDVSWNLRNQARSMQIKVGFQPKK